ncbi:STAS domain-containing protein [Phytohabitans sp. ZYX-F-186]|uniref:STAS domain-containing protein n=1 Tax=Phytohabitans maris TaxID=3071409 RepID=A0ABU0ZKP1_9ACTN|nr:STAS domain-containing protein [Phytohabitans sp. ZYX-F-186]MDQ7907619.1 STAS domain-containing protein [Phytohabitans sp. ZYX-F-186]
MNDDPTSETSMNDDPRSETSMLITELHTESAVRLLPFGEIDLATVGQVRDAIIAVLARDNPAAIALDLQHVSFIDSTGIGELVRCHRAAAVSGSVLTVENLAPFPRRQLWATGLLGLFGLADQYHDDGVLARHIEKSA